MIYKGLGPLLLRLKLAACALALVVSASILSAPAAKSCADFISVSR